MTPDPIDGRATIQNSELERLRADASLGRFLSPLFTQFEQLVTDIAEERYRPTPPDLLQAARALLVMTPERAKRWKPETWVVRR